MPERKFSYFSPRPGRLKHCRTLNVVPGVFLLDRSKSGWMGITDAIRETVELILKSKGIWEAVIDKARA